MNKKASGDPSFLVKLILFIVILVVCFFIIKISGDHINLNWSKLTFGGLFSSGGEVLPAGGGSSSQTGGLSDSDVRSVLERNGISVNKPKPGTSFDGLKQATLDEMIRFKKDCDEWAKTQNLGSCEVVITAGTESTGGHATGECSHGTGYKFDLRPNSNVDKYIKAVYTRGGQRAVDSAQLYSLNGITYASEGDHWDVVTICPVRT
jgi:hypothetical protein